MRRISAYARSAVPAEAVDRAMCPDAGRVFLPGRYRRQFRDGGLPSIPCRGPRSIAPTAQASPTRRRFRRAHEQNARDWKVDAHIDRKPDGGAVIVLHASDAGQWRAAYRFGISRAISSAPRIVAPISLYRLDERGEGDLSRHGDRGRSGTVGSGDRGRRRTASGCSCQ